MRYMPGRIQLHSQHPPTHVETRRASTPVREHAFQDFLVPSIEVASRNFPSPHQVDRSSMRNHTLGESHAQRRYEQPRSPPKRQVIVIEDDSPQAKQPRLIRAQDSSHFRVATSPTRIQYLTTERYDSPEAVASRARDIHSIRARPAGVHDPYHTPGSQRSRVGDAQERLPVYDAPMSGTFAQHPRQLGLSEIGYRPVSNSYASESIAAHSYEIHQSGDNSRHVLYPGNARLEEDRILRGREQHHFHPIERRRSGSPPYRPSAYTPPLVRTGAIESNTRPTAVDHHLVQRFSDARIGSHGRQRSDGVIVLSEGEVPDGRQIHQPYQYEDR